MMKSTLKIVMTAAAMTLVVGCASDGGPMKATKDAVAKVMPGSKADAGVTAAIAQAKAAQKKAASVGGEWRDTGKMIKKAEKLNKEGKHAEASKMAIAAENQGHAGYKQAMAQKGAGPQF